MQNLVNASNPPKIMSVSYGTCEAEDGAAFERLDQFDLSAGGSRRHFGVRGGGR